MKKPLSIILVMLICLTANSATLASAANGVGLNLSSSILHENEPINSIVPREAVWKEIVSMPYGIGSGEVGLYKDDITTWGANVVLIDDDGNISILDGYNNRILIYNPAGRFSHIDLPNNVTGLNMCQANGSYYVLDAQKDNVYEVNKSNKEVSEFMLPDGVSFTSVDRLMPTADGGVAIIDAHYEKDAATITNDKSVKLISNPLSVSVDGTIATIKDGDMSWTIELPSKRCGINYIGKDKFGNAYVRVSEYVPNTAAVIFEPTIRKYSKDGEQVGIALIPSKDWIFCADRYAYVTNDGHLYVMGFGESKATVYEVILGAEHSSTMNDLAKRAETIEEEIRANSVMGQTFNITRSAVYANAVAMTGTQWTLKAGNKIPPSSDVTIPSYILNTPAGTAMTGIPYCWGGMNGNYDAQSGDGYRAFTTMIAKSYGSNLFSAGNVSCTGNRKAGTAGVDCSGFVSCAFRFTTKWNAQKFLDDFGYLVSYDDWSYMDVMAKSNHVMLYLGYLINVDKYDVYEATTMDSINKTVLRTISADYASNFTFKTNWP